MPNVQIPITTSVGGDFQVAHNLGVTPLDVSIQMTSLGAIVFQPARYDNTYIYLEASDSGLTAVLQVFYNPSVTPIINVTVSGNSTITIQELVDDALTFGDIAPVLATGGNSMAPALSIVNDTVQAMINGGQVGQPFNFKWNRFNLPAFPTISLQQDYFIPGLSNLAWLESAWAVQVNQTSIPKQKIQLEVKKDLQTTYAQTSGWAKICWIPNSIATTGAWGIAPVGPTLANPSGDITQSGPGETGQQNPGPNVVYTDPIGTLQTPQNASTCITDQHGNLWATDYIWYMRRNYTRIFHKPCLPNL